MSTGVMVPDCMEPKLALAQERIEWMVHKDTILRPVIVVPEVPEPSTARNRKNAMKKRREKKSCC